MQTVRYDSFYSKGGMMIYISHLDVMTLFRRAVRRADLPFFLTGGFTPRVKISVPKALKLGTASEKEEMSFWLTEPRGENEIEEAMNRNLPDGIRLFGTKMKERQP